MPVRSGGAPGRASPAVGGHVSGQVELIDKGGKPASDLSDVVVYVDGVKAKPKPAAPRRSR